MPESEVIGQLMSSYWIFEELAQVMAESPFDDSHLETEEGTAEQAATEPEATATPEVETSKPQPEQTEAETTSKPEEERPSWESIVAIIDALADFSEPRPAPDWSSQRSQPAHLPSAEHSRRLDRLNATVSELSRRFETDMDRTTALIEQIVDRLTAVEDSHSLANAKLAELQASVRSDSEAAGTLISDVESAAETALQEVMETRSAQAGWNERAARVLVEQADRLKSIEARLEASETAQDTLDQTVRTHDSDLNSAVRVFNRLHTGLTRLDDRTNTLIEELVPVMLSRREHDRLATIRTQATRLAIKHANCESCGRKVDVKSLMRPTCPYCDIPVDGLRRHRRFLRRRAILTTGDTTSGEDPMAWAADIWPTEQVAESPSQRNAAETGFNWIGDASP